MILREGNCQEEGGADADLLIGWHNHQSAATTACKHFDVGGLVADFIHLYWLHTRRLLMFRSRRRRPVRVAAGTPPLNA